MRGLLNCCYPDSSLFSRGFLSQLLPRAFFLATSLELPWRRTNCNRKRFRITLTLLKYLNYWKIANTYAIDFWAMFPLEPIDAFCHPERFCSFTKLSPDKDGGSNCRHLTDSLVELSKAGRPPPGGQLCVKYEFGAKSI